MGWRAKVTGEFSQLLHLHAFPYDCHNIEILISSDHLTSVCKLEPNVVVPSGAQVARFSIKDQWDLSFDKDSVKTIGERKGAGGAYSQLTARIPATRNPTYHLANTMLLMCLVVLLFFVSVFSVPRLSKESGDTQIANRMEIASNSVLTAVALKLLSAEQLPDLPYMTFLDKYMLGCIFLLVGLVLFIFIIETLDYRMQYREEADCDPRPIFQDCIMDQIDVYLGNGGMIIWFVLNIRLYTPLLKTRNEKTDQSGIMAWCKRGCGIFAFCKRCRKPTGVPS